jgi:nitrite reductase (cytochrome c-552)
MSNTTVPEPDELDPAVWGQNFPRQYDAFMRTQDDTISTPYGGSVPYSKLERYPAMVRIWAGYAFSKDHNEERGHYYTTIDQKNTQRVQLVRTAGACANCHAAEAPQLIEEMGWEEFNHTPYNEMKDRNCTPVHPAPTATTRRRWNCVSPARRLYQRHDQTGVDWTQASRQEMRTYVCAQCHVEYYFLGDNKVLTFPWSQG